MKRETMWVRAWALRNVFLLWFVRPSIVELTDDRCELVIPLSWRTRRRDIHAMYLGVLVMVADHTDADAAQLADQLRGLGHRARQHSAAGGGTTADVDRRTERTQLQGDSLADAPAGTRHDRNPLRFVHAFEFYHPRHETPGWRCVRLHPWTPATSRSA